jgi:hypothetical protein
MTMKRIIAVYGCIAGVILVIGFEGSMATGLMSHDAGGMVLGYTIMLVALSMVFVGVKKYRDEQLGGVIRFGTAVRLGFGIAAVAALFYVLGWEAYLYATDYSFMPDYTAAAIEAQRAAGASAAELAALETEMAGYVEMYANPLTRMAMTLVEIAPVALLAPLLSAALLCNPRFMPARR